MSVLLALFDPLPYVTTCHSKSMSEPHNSLFSALDRASKKYAEYIHFHFWAILTFWTLNAVICNYKSNAI